MDYNTSRSLKEYEACKLKIMNLHGRKSQISYAYRNKPNCVISLGFAVTYNTISGLALAGWLTQCLGPGEASHYLFYFNIEPCNDISNYLII